MLILKGDFKLLNLTFNRMLICFISRCLFALDLRTLREKKLDGTYLIPLRHRPFQNLFEFCNLNVAKLVLTNHVLQPKSNKETSLLLFHDHQTTWSSVLWILARILDKEWTRAQVTGTVCSGDLRLSIVYIKSEKKKKEEQRSEYNRRTSIVVDILFVIHISRHGQRPRRRRTLILN